MITPREQANGAKLVRMRLRSTLLCVLASVIAACGGSAATTDAGPDAHVDAARLDAAGDAATMHCDATDPWTTYGHDAQRTFASGGCIPGALATDWRYAPAAPSGHTVTSVFHAIADGSTAYLQWSASNAMYLGTSAVDAVDATAGTRRWTWDSGTDTTIGNWATLGRGSVFVEDDGLYELDAASGMHLRDTGVDWWGQTAVDGARLYAVNASHVDGPGVFVAALDAMLHPTWQQNQYGMCRIDVTDTMGGLAVVGDTVYYAPSYQAGTGVTLPFQSGVFAFDAASGTPKWSQPTTPSSAISADATRVYLAQGGASLVARNVSDGAVAWSSAGLTGLGAQAPVLAGGLAIVATSTAVSAFHADSGTMAWTTPITGAAGSAFSIEFTGGCAGLLPQGAANGTTLAAAAGSGTLVVTASDGVHVLSLASGADLWHGMPTMAVGRVSNPVIAGNTVYVVDVGHGLLALRPM